MEFDEYIKRYPNPIADDRLVNCLILSITRDVWGHKQFEIDELKKEIEKLKLSLKKIRELVDKQAEDEGLWFVANHIGEAHLQHALRALHSVIEVVSDKKSEEPARVKSEEIYEEIKKIIIQPNDFSREEVINLHLNIMSSAITAFLLLKMSHTEIKDWFDLVFHEAKENVARIMEGIK